MKFTQFIRHIHRRPSPERAAVKTNEPCLTSVWICCILWSWSFSVLFFQGRCEKILQYWASDSLKPTWTHNIEARPGWEADVLMSHRSSDGKPHESSVAFGSWIQTPTSDSDFLRGYGSFTFSPFGNGYGKMWVDKLLILRDVALCDLWICIIISSIALDMDGDSRIAITFLAAALKGSLALYLGVGEDLDLNLRIGPPASSIWVSTTLRVSWCLVCESTFFGVTPSLRWT